MVHVIALRRAGRKSQSEPMLTLFDDVCIRHPTSMGAANSRVWNDLLKAIVGALFNYIHFMDTYFIENKILW